MVKQILAPPVTSAGVERVFSAAGRMHSDEQKRATGETLKHALFASFNVREWTARALACVCVISVCVGGMKWRYLDPNYLAITASNRGEILANCIQQIQILLLIVSSK